MNLYYFPPIETGDKIEKIVDLFKELIIEGKLKPGQNLPPERDLAAMLNVSRYSLREALRAAQAHGLIELNRGKRPKVKPPSSEALNEIFGITIKRSNISLFDLTIARISLECDIVSIVARRADEELIKKLEKVNHEMETHREDIKYCALIDLEFHDILVDYSMNPVFKIMLDSVGTHLTKSRLATLKLTGVERALRGHRSITNALKQNDQEKARAAMLSHLEMAEDDIKIIEHLDKERLPNL